MFYNHRGASGFSLSTASQHCTLLRDPLLVQQGHKSHFFPNTLLRPRPISTKRWLSWKRALSPTAWLDGSTPLRAGWATTVYLHRRSPLSIGRLPTPGDAWGQQVICPARADDDHQVSWARLHRQATIAARARDGETAET